MTDNTESTPEAAKVIVENVAQDVVTDVKAETPGIVAHLEAFGTWTKDEIEKAYEWIKSKI